MVVRAIGVPAFRPLRRNEGRGIGARYQGWTPLAIRCFEDLARG